MTRSYGSALTAITALAHLELVDMIVFGFSHVDKCVLIISSVASAIGLFIDVWFILAYSGADANSTLLRLIAFLARSSRLPLITLSAAALALVTFEKVRGLLTG
ncbi:hypothetical protein EDB85DRAFT_2155685 [Lactarius pseudohatsudake]|nr:hypothetical protein EDB85DRAFT_2155685 [Lactarius pseudohatsudake]